ncbi:MAG: hypothetical protein WAV95_06750 [Azonexus sp.]
MNQRSANAEGAMLRGAPPGTGLVMLPFALLDACLLSNLFVIGGLTTVTVLTALLLIVLTVGLALWTSARMHEQRQRQPGRRHPDPAPRRAA